MRNKVINNIYEIFFLNLHFLKNIFFYIGINQFFPVIIIQSIFSFWNDFTIQKKRFSNWPILCNGGGGYSNILHASYLTGISTEVSIIHSYQTILTWASVMLQWHLLPAKEEHHSACITLPTPLDVMIAATITYIFKG